MGVIEQYESEIQKQKGLDAKIKLSKRILRDTKKRRLSNSPALRSDMDPMAEKVFDESSALIDYIQADLEYLQSQREGTQQLDKSDSREDSKIQKIRWTGENYRLLVALFELLFEANLIDDKSLKNTAALMAHHFSNNGSDISADGVRQYRYNDYRDDKKELVDRLFHLLDDAAGKLTQ